MSFEVVEMKDLSWGFGSREPSIHLKVGEGWGRTVNVDPFPCYAHKKELLEQMLDKVTKDFPIGFNTKLFSLYYEDFDRTNAWASYESIYEDNEDKDKPRKFNPFITTNGKRIPPHPAMTRYLVAHEYGHIVEHWIAYCKGNKDLSLHKEYNELRNVGTVPYYGGRTWHKSVGEVLANDFRILICGVESEYWVHEVPYPTEVPEVISWWHDALQYKFLDKQE